jgi:2-phosphoglycerate kinase
VVRSDYGLPYSKGLMAQSLMATGLPSERSFALAQQIEERLVARRSTEISVDELRAVAEEAVAAGEGEPVLARFRQWWNVRNLDRPLLVLLGGVTGVGKSTVATQLAGRLGIPHVIATDQVRQVVRAFFSHEFLPSVHHSSFDVSKALSDLTDDAPGTIAGYFRQAHDIAPGLDAVVERAISDRTPMVVEGVHLLPDIPDAHLCERATTVRVMLAVRDEAAHREHFHTRGMQTMREPERYLEALDRIRILQNYLIERSEAAGVPVIEASGSEMMWRRVLEVVLDAVGAASGAKRPSR